jgi:hypothetical protein
MSYVTVDQAIENLENYRGYYVKSISLEALQDDSKETKVNISLMGGASVSHKESVLGE